MEPISAFRQFIPPTLSAPAAKALDASGASGGLIPASELQKVNGDLPLRFVDQTGGGGSFENTLSRFVQGVNDKQTAAGDAVRGLTGGGNVSLHQAMISMEEAGVSFQLMVEVRNKLLESYQELMRMQI